MSATTQPTGEPPSENITEPNNNILANTNYENPTCANATNYRYLQYGNRAYEVFSNPNDYTNALASSIYLPPIAPESLNLAQNPTQPQYPLEPNPYKRGNLYASNPNFRVVNSIPWLAGPNFTQQQPIMQNPMPIPFTMGYYNPIIDEMQRKTSTASFLSIPELSSTSSTASSASATTDWTQAMRMMNRDTIPLPVQPILNGTSKDSSLLEFINSTKMNPDKNSTSDISKREIEADITWNENSKIIAWLRQNRSHRKQLQASGFKVLNLGVRQKVCSICHMSFSKEMFVWRHASRHTACKPFHCVACNQRFTRSDTLQRHVRRTGHSQSS